MRNSNNPRSREPVHIAEPIGDIVDRLSMRFAGKKIDEFEKDRIEMFLHDVRTGRFPVRRLFTIHQVARACKHYLLDWDDFDGDQYGVDHPELRLTKLERDILNDHRKPPFKVRVEKNMAGQMMVEWMEVRSELRRVIRYRYVGVGGFYTSAA